MPKVELTVPRGDSDTLALALDESILGEVIRPQRVEPVGDEEGAIETALDHPIGAARLEDALGAALKEYGQDTMVAVITLGGRQLLTWSRHQEEPQGVAQA